MSKFFINRPIVAMVISILMTIVGLVAMSGLPTAQFPDIVPPQITVKTTYTGADALTVEKAVATALDRGARSGDIGGTLGTVAMGDAVLAALAG